MKYMGSKSRIAKHIVPIIQKFIDDNKITTYIEPFVGGANIIDKIKCEKRIGYDSNEFLISMWRAIQKGYLPPHDVSKIEYDDIKNSKEKYPKELVAVVGFCATYNAKWFGGYAGKVTTKIGTVRNYYDESVRNILKQKPYLENVEFIHSSFSQLPINSIKNCVIYCDPPYEGTTKYRDTFSHEVYWSWVRDLSQNNIVLCSEYNAPDDFICIYSKELTTTLDKNSRKKDTEKLFIHRSKI